MADLDDMEMVKCPHCGKTCPKDFYPVCSCKQNLKKKEKEEDKSGGKPEDPYDY